MRRPDIVIVDRDGVINYDSPAYIKSPGEWRPIEGSLEAIARLHRAGYPVYVATNQAGVGRGHFDLEMLDAIHAHMVDAARSCGGEIAGIFYCPHRPDDDCDCRKPRPGLLRQIAAKAGVAVGDQVYVGDSLKDISAARAVGCQPVLVLTGNGRQTLAELDEPVRCYENLLAFVDDLLADGQRPVY